MLAFITITLFLELWFGDFVCHNIRILFVCFLVCKINLKLLFDLKTIFVCVYSLFCIIYKYAYILWYIYIVRKPKRHSFLLYHINIFYFVVLFYTKKTQTHTHKRDMHTKYTSSQQTKYHTHINEKPKHTKIPSSPVTSHF
jgi:hypothetical protein